MTNTEKLLKIVEKIGRKAVLEQLMEECGELVFAAAKQMRIFRGTNYTPVTLADNTNNLIEELSDVLLCIDAAALTISPFYDATLDQIRKTKEAKLERWLERLELKKK